MSVYKPGTNVTTAVLHQEMAHRIAHFARQAAPKHTHKWLMSVADMSEHTAKKVLDGRFPSPAHFARMCAKLGPAFVGFVMEPCGDWASILQAHARLDALEAEYTALGRKIRDTALWEAQHREMARRTPSALAPVASEAHEAGRGVSYREGAPAVGSIDAPVAAQRRKVPAR